MILFFDHHSVVVVNSIDLYSKLGLNLSHYSRWMDSNLVQLSENEIDYYNIGVVRIGKSRPRKHYYITVEFAKTLCTLAKTNKALNLRRWIINKQIEDSLQSTV